MKKLLCAFFAMVALAGCSSGSGGTKETKTCSLDMKPITMDITFNATDDKIETASIKVSMDYTSLGIEATELTDEQKATIEDAVFQQLGIKEGTGVDVSTEFSDDTLAATVDIDLKEGDSSTLEALGFGSDGDYLLSDTVKAAEEGGATCK